MRIVSILILLLFISYSSHAQKKLSLYKTFGGVVYQLDTTTLSGKQVMIVLQPNPEAYKEFKLARRKARVGSIIGFTGGLLIAVPLVTAVAGGKPEWQLAAIGGGLFLISIPFHISFKGHAFNAFEMYNSSLPTSRTGIRPSFHFYGTGAAISIKF